MRFVVVGGGILGLATARALSTSVHGAEVIVLEKETVPGRHQTSHNSGVVHAGIYYRPGSLKARLCRRGLGLLREFCHERSIPYESCGKLVIATEPSELPRLERLGETAAENGVPGLRWLEGDAIQRTEP